MLRSPLLALVLGCSVVPGALAQTAGAGYADALSPSLASVANAMHATIRRDLAEAADRMPAEEYGFRPSPEVRTFGELVGHHQREPVLLFATWRRARSAAINYEQATSKAALLKALNDTLALGDRVYQQTTDANFSQAVDMAAGVGMGPAKTLRGAILMFNVAHNNEHYGNIVVYMRLKGDVPPSTARTRATGK